MASSNKTKKLKLNQWVKADKPTMSDFNEDNRILEEELAKRLNMPVVIPANSNLNNYIVTGLYYQGYTNDAETINNTASPYAFSLFVEKTGVGGVGVKQTFTVYHTSDTFIRNYLGGSSWTPWKQIAMVEPINWIVPTLLNGTEQSSSMPVRYRKELNMVIVEGWVTKATIVTPMFVLPEDYRTSNTIYRIGSVSAANTYDHTTSRIGVYPNGQVVILNVANKEMFELNGTSVSMFFSVG